MERIAFGGRDPDVISSVASRLARLDRQVDREDRLEIEQLAGMPISNLVAQLVAALDPDSQVAAAKAQTQKEEPSAEEIASAAKSLLNDAVKPIVSNPKLRLRLIEIKSRYEQMIDIVSQDAVTRAEFDASARQKAEVLVQSFAEYIEKNKDQITALQLLYSRPYQQRLRYDQIKELANAIKRPGDGYRPMDPEKLWQAYEALDKSKVHGSGGQVLTDVVSLVRYAIHQQNELHPYREDVDARFADWVQAQRKQGVLFTAEQMTWLEGIRQHIGINIEIDREDFDNVPFVLWGGLGKAHQLFGERLQPLLNELNEVLGA